MHSFSGLPFQGGLFSTKGVSGTTFESFQIDILVLKHRVDHFDPALLY
jgi:hypothetical protein